MNLVKYKVKYDYYYKNISNDIAVSKSIIVVSSNDISYERRAYDIRQEIIRKISDVINDETISKINIYYVGKEEIVNDRMRYRTVYDSKSGLSTIKSIANSIAKLNGYIENIKTMKVLAKYEYYVLVYHEGSKTAQHEVVVSNPKQIAIDLNAKFSDEGKYKIIKYTKRKRVHGG